MRRPATRALVCLLAAAGALSSGAATSSAQSGSLLVGTLSTGAQVRAYQTGSGWGVRVTKAGLADLNQPSPVQMVYDPGDPTGSGGTFQNPVQQLSAAYTSLTPTTDATGAPDGFTATGSLSPVSGVTVTYSDTWTITGDVLSLTRDLTVHGAGAGGFDSAIALSATHPVTRAQTDYLVPGTIYGSTANLESVPGTTNNAIGSQTTYDPGYHGIVHVREDQLPTPLFALHFRDGSSVSLLDPAPNGETTSAEGSDEFGSTKVDPRFRFGALGADQSAGKLDLGYWFPGSEGEISYVGAAIGVKGIDSAHRWVRREHPLSDGLTQHYTLDWRFARDQSWSEARTGIWNWAWKTMNPQLNPQPTDLVRQSLVNQLLSTVVTNRGGTGIPVAYSPSSGEQSFNPSWTQGFGPEWSEIGFLGRVLENSEHLIEDSYMHPGDFADPAKARAAGEAVINSLTPLSMDPPESEGIDLQTGLPTSYPYPDPGQVHLRSLGQDFTALLRAYEAEKANGTDQPKWLAWATQMGDWLLTQQDANGGFPRIWAQGSGAVIDSSESATSSAIPFLVELSKVTGQQSLLVAAERAGAFAWTLNRSGQYWGGTEDQGNIISKESASEALNANLALYQATGDPRWLRYAQQAAQNDETWIFTWNVPMPVDAASGSLTWQPGVPTTGVGAVATGGNGVDNYLSNDVTAFAQLYKYTGEQRYFDIARLLLNNSFSMLALPGRTYGLHGPGWSYEYWALALGRGTSGLDDWAAWVDASMLHGVLQTEQFDPSLFAQLATS